MSVAFSKKRISRALTNQLKIRNVNVIKPFSASLPKSASIRFCLLMIMLKAGRNTENKTAILQLFFRNNDPVLITLFME